MTRSLAEIYKKWSVAVLEPTGYEEATRDPKWIIAIQKEMRIIHKNQTWELVDKPLHKKAIGVKWVYRLNVDGTVNKHKARLVMKGYA